MTTFLLIILFGAVSFVQNMFFTFTSRSRNSGDPNYHRKAAWGSNGVWMLNQLFLVKVLYKPVLENNNWGFVALAVLVYVLATTEGSVLMMRIMLGQTKENRITRLFTEKGKRSVGAK